MKLSKLLVVLLSLLIVTMPLSSIWAIPIQTHHQTTLKSPEKSCNLILAETEEVNEDNNEYDLESFHSDFWIDYSALLFPGVVIEKNKAVQSKIKHQSNQQLYLLNRCILI